MEKFIYFDYVAIILLGVLLFSTIFRKMTAGTTNRMFLVILFTTLGATVFDIWAVTLDNIGSVNFTMLYAAHTGYIFFHNLTMPLYVMFIISLTDTWHRFFKSNALKIALVLPISVVIIFLIANLFTGIVFTVENGYAHGKAFFILYLATAFYAVYGLAYLFYYRNLFHFSKLAATTALIPIGIITMLIQMFFPSFLLEMFANTLCLLFVSMAIQRPETFIDSFTGLRVYSAYADDMKHAFANEKHVNIVMINIANFISLQAMLSYDITKELLQKIAEILEDINKKLKCCAAIYYLDRGRFRMVIPESLYGKAEEASSMLNDELKKNIPINGFDLNIMAFICLAKCPEDIKDFSSLMSFGANFHEKIPYTGTVLYAGEEFEKRHFGILNNIELIIKRGLKNNGFKMYYQPIYSVEQKRFVSAEALIRLYDEEYGFISPEILIPAAEKNGSIHQIGDFVIESVCGFIASDEYKQLGLDYIEVNLSVAQCMHGDLADKILSVMKKYGVSADQINLEITETAASYSQNVMSENLDKLSAAGISFSLDDYGTGYSNIKRVIQLPLKIVKLDKSFVDDQDNPKMRIILKNTVKMLKDMNMEIVVEGIETFSMVELFSSLKCDFIQGYYYSKPIPKDEFVSFIISSKAFNRRIE